MAVARQQGQTDRADALKKQIDQQQLALSARYKSFRVDYSPKQGMYKGGTFSFYFRLTTDYPRSAPLCHCGTPIWHPNITHELATALTLSMAQCC